MTRRHRLLPTLVALVAVVIGGAGTTRADSSEATPTAETMTVSAYFLRENKIGAAHREIAIPDDKRVATAAMRELLQGPTKAERDAGLTTDIPKQTVLLGVELDEATKVATVDLSAAFTPDDKAATAAPLAQVIFTLTQFPNIERVAIAVEGEPIALVNGDDQPLDGPAARADYDHKITPLIFLESPAPGDTIASPVRLWGTANTFEATFMADILDANGNLLVSQLITATSGNGFRGTFDVTLDFEVAQAGEGEVVVYELSAKDGSRVNEVRVPVELSDVKTNET